MHRHLILLLALVFTAGCESKGTTAPAAPSATAAASAAPGEPPALKPAPAKAFTPTEEQAIGTLPDGVGVAAGAKAPDFELDSIDGKKVSLSGLLKTTRVLVVFYRGGW